MQNGLRHTLTGKFAPETAVGTGAKEPLVVEFDAASAVPSVDESTLGASKKSKNLPATPAKLAYHGDNGAKAGEDYQTRTNPNAHADDAEANQLASAVRPAKPQAVKASQKRS